MIVMLGPISIETNHHRQTYFIAFTIVHLISNVLLLVNATVALPNYAVVDKQLRYHGQDEGPCRSTMRRVVKDRHEGVLRNPVSPRTGTYRRNEDCKWLLKSDGPLKLTFTELDVELSAGCRFDSVTIYDAVTNVTLCGKMPNATYTTHGNTLIRFRSDSSNEGKGFLMRYKKERGSSSGNDNDNDNGNGGSDEIEPIINSGKGMSNKVNQQSSSSVKRSRASSAASSGGGGLTPSYALVPKQRSTASSSNKLTRPVSTVSNSGVIRPSPFPSLQQSHQSAVNAQQAPSPNRQQQQQSSSFSAANYNNNNNNYNNNYNMNNVGPVHAVCNQTVTVSPYGGVIHTYRDAVTGTYLPNQDCFIVLKSPFPVRLTFKHVLQLQDPGKDGICRADGLVVYNASFTLREKPKNTSHIFCGITDCSAICNSLYTDGDAMLRFVTDSALEYNGFTLHYEFAEADKRATTIIASTTISSNNNGQQQLQRQLQDSSTKFTILAEDLKEIIWWGGQYPISANGAASSGAASSHHHQQHFSFFFFSLLSIIIITCFFLFVYS